MDAVVDIIGAIAWPITVLILAFVLRRELRHALSRLTILKYRDLEAHFEAGLEILKTTVHPMLDKTPKRAEYFPFGGRLQELQLLAEQSPRGGVLGAWVVLERVIDAIARSSGVPKTHTGGEAVRTLLDAGKLTQDDADIIIRLQHLRNLALHGEEFSLTPRSVKSYIAYILNLAAWLRTSLPNHLREPET